MLPLPEFAGLRREARRVPPAYTGKSGKGSGGRDAAIWLSTLVYAASKKETVYLVSGDTDAFHKSDLTNDVAAAGATAKIFRNVGELLGELGTDVAAGITRDQVARSHAAVSAIRATDAEGFIGGRPTLTRQIPLPTRGDYQYYYGVQRADLVSIENVRAYEVGDAGAWATLGTLWRISTYVELDFAGTHPRWWLSYNRKATLLCSFHDGEVQDAEIVSLADPAAFQLTEVDDTQLSPSLDSLGSVRVYVS